MKIELKSVKVYEKLSEETTCFTANIYLDGKKIGEAENRGIGGNTMYVIQDRHLLEKFETYANSLPPMTFIVEGEPFSYKMNGEHLIDNLVWDFIKKRDEKNMQAKIARYEKKCKTDFAAQGFVTLRVVDDKDNYHWLACKSDAEKDIRDRIKMFEDKKAVTIMEYKLI